MQRMKRYNYVLALVKGSAFFYKLANSCSKFNYMFSIMVEGSSFNSLENMKPAIQGYYSSFFYDVEPWRPKVDGLALPTITDLHRADIEMHFSKDEVFKALHQCCGDKAPSLKGMTMAFL